MYGKWVVVVVMVMVGWVLLVLSTFWFLFFLFLFFFLFFSRVGGFVCGEKEKEREKEGGVVWWDGMGQTAFICIA